MKTSISDASSYREIGEFWDEHDLSEYWDQTHEVQMEINLVRRSGPRKEKVERADN